MFRRGPKSDWPDPIKIMAPDGQVREVVPGWSGRIKVEKTRINMNEGREILLPFKHGVGFDSKSATINSAFGLNIIQRTGASYTNAHLPDGKMVGKDNVIKFFNENNEAYTKLAEDVLLTAAKSIEVHETEE